MASRMKALYNQVLFERRILFGCTVLVGLCACFWAVSIAIDHWYILESSDGTGLTCLESRGNGSVGLFKYMGLWKYCEYGTERVDSGTSTETKPYVICKFHNMFPAETPAKQNVDLDQTVLNYSRTQGSFAVMSMAIMLMGFGFSIYTFRNPRYMFKRLAGGIHFIGAACVMVVIQVLLSAAEYESDRCTRQSSPDAIMTYDYSLILAWFVFIGVLISGCAFMIFSKKRKRDRAPTEEIAMADEPTIIGR
ncbi:transmembrane protein 114 [Orussus abietinus]|uniref:transmembrane protein 114 n=1 Tax=Orussus abietinus TaxID=222816 RepID=UPI000625D7B1|nr:transmembrane protein 114 [Orussus abietinus]XP_012271953.1 transmembrane protein 114 [Orussus abietinus]